MARKHKRRRRSPLGPAEAAVLVLVGFVLGALAVRLGGLEAAARWLRQWDLPRVLETFPESLPDPEQLPALSELLPDATPEPLPEGTLTVVRVLDVGQGDAVLIQQDDAACLIDAGTQESSEDLVRQLWDAGVDDLDFLVMTHPHADHYGGMPQVLEDFPVRTLLMPDLEGLGASGAALDEILRLADEQGTTCITAARGQSYPLGQGTLEVLLAVLPDDDNLNNASLCLRFTAGNFTFLDTGDAEADTEQRLVDAYGSDLRATLFKAGHHGSATSTTQPLLDAVRPQAVAISCGLNNSYGHPDAETLDRIAASGAQVWRTDQEGAITFTWDGTSLQAITAGAGNALDAAA